MSAPLGTQQVSHQYGYGRIDEKPPVDGIPFPDEFLSWCWRRSRTPYLYLDWTGCPWAQLPGVAEQVEAWAEKNGWIIISFPLMIRLESEGGGTHHAPRRLLGPKVPCEGHQWCWCSYCQGDGKRHTELADAHPAAVCQEPKK